MQIEHRREDCIYLLYMYDKRAAYVLIMKYFNDDVPIIDIGFDDG
jgi:hypothetical protein